MASVNTMDSPAVRYMDTVAAYDLWSEIYDTDGNFLQALDTIEMKELLPRMLSEIKTGAPWRIVDLGCGTGRNTVALLSIPDANIIALDASPKMLETAKSRLQNASRQQSTTGELRFEVFDLLQSTNPPDFTMEVDAIVSTLVIEHVPTDSFFKHASMMLRPDGVLLLTNMHSEMGQISQAGFVDPQTGEKIRPKSYAHTTSEVVSAAEKYGLVPIGHMAERSVDADMTQVLGSRSSKWVGITVWFGGLFRKQS